MWKIIQYNEIFFHQINGKTERRDRKKEVLEIKRFKRHIIQIQYVNLDFPKITVKTHFWDKQI